jgi:hypothetical protein
MSYNKTVNDSISVNTRIDQPMEHDIHRGIRGEYHVPWVDQLNMVISMWTTLKYGYFYVDYN